MAVALISDRVLNRIVVDPDPPVACKHVNSFQHCHMPSILSHNDLDLVRAGRDVESLARMAGEEVARRRAEFLIFSARTTTSPKHFQQTV